MRGRLKKARCARCGHRRDVWIWVGDEQVCGGCSTFEEFGGAIGAVGMPPVHLRAVGRP